MRFFINGEETNGEETNMNEEEARKLEQDVKVKSDEIAQAAVKKVEPVTRIITVLGFTFTAVFLWARLAQGRFDVGTVWLLFWRVEAGPTAYILAAAMTLVALWHLASTVRFFVKRNKK